MTEVPAEPPTPPAEPHAPEAAPEPVEPRRYPSTIGGTIYLLVLAVALTGVGIAAAGRSRLGITWLGLALLGAAAARLVLPDDRAGMLRVRRKLVDVTLLVCLGGGLLLVLSSLPVRD